MREKNLKYGKKEPEVIWLHRSRNGMTPRSPGWYEARIREALGEPVKKMGIVVSIREVSSRREIHQVREMDERRKRAW